MTRQQLLCREFVDATGDYLDGELSRSARGRFDSHLEACRECALYLDGYEKVIRLQSLAREPESAPSSAPEALVAAILAARSPDC